MRSTPASGEVFGMFKNVLIYTFYQDEEETFPVLNIQHPPHGVLCKHMRRKLGIQYKTFFLEISF